MNTKNISFDELPHMVHQLSEQVLKLTALVELKTPEENTNDLISRVEACKELGISVVTCWTWAKQGKIKTYKIGNKVYLKRSEIKEIIDHNITKK